MKKTIFIHIAALLLPFVIHSQNIEGCRVAGAVTDSLSVPIESAIVHICAVPDDGYTKTVVTNKNGTFAFEGIRNGKYTLTVSHLSFQTGSRNVDVHENTDLPVIRLLENARMLDVVDISANTIKYTADRYNISLLNNPITKGKNTAEVLGLLPAVTREQGTLKIFGKAVSRVRINGVLIRDMKELEAIQADNLDNVEVVYMSGVDDTSPGAGGELNIQLQKPKTGGYFGSVSGNTSMNFKYGNTDNGINSSISYGNKKWSVYNYTSLNYNNLFTDNGFETRYLQLGQVNRQTEFGRGWWAGLSTRLSVTYDISKKHTVGVNFSYSRYESEPLNNTSSLLTDADGNETARSTSERAEWSLNNHYQATFDYKWKLDDKGSQFNLKGDYLGHFTDRERGYTNISDAGLPGETVGYMNYVFDNSVDMYYLNAKFDVKVGEKSSTQFGLNYNGNRTHQLFDYTNLEGTEWIIDDRLSDDYKLHGDNYAAFASFSSGIGDKFTYKLGARYEHRRMGFNSLKAGAENIKTYNTLNLSADLMYMLNQQKGNMLMLMYIRGAPSIPYSAITPVILYYDEYSYTKGNLNLEPQVYNYIMLNAMFEQKWTFAILYSGGKNSTHYQTFVDETDPLVTYTMPVNEGFYWGFSIMAERIIKIAVWWDLKTNVRWEWDRQRHLGGKYVYNKYSFDIENSFRMKNDWGGSLGFEMEPGYKPRADFTLTTDLGVTGGIYKNMFDNRLRINLSGVIYGINRNTITNTQDIWRKQIRNTRFYRIELRLTYNFRGGKKVNVKQTSGEQQYQEMKDSSRN